MRRTRLVWFLVLGTTLALAQGAPPDAKADVLAVEAAFNQAKLKNDVVTLKRIVADDYVGINQWGAIRDKKDLLELFSNFTTTSLESSNVRVRIEGDHATVIGVLHESNAWKFLFLRTYVKRQGQWLLVNSVHTFPLNPDGMRPIDPEVVFRANEE